jgi:hypothetical protein
MKRHEAGDEASVRALLDYLNVCHDGVVRRISFLKDVAYTEEGDVSWPAPSEAGQGLMAPCSIEMELLLNSYATAAPKQIVLLRFEAVRSFRFFQENTLDYSFIYEVVLNESGAGEFEFLFRVGWAEKVEALRIVCPRIVCMELDS